jgi:gluconokinase
MPTFARNLAQSAFPAYHPLASMAVASVAFAVGMADILCLCYHFQGSLSSEEAPLGSAHDMHRCAWLAKGEEELDMASRACTIGVDMGTTHVKSVAIAADGRELARAEETLTLAHDESGAATQPPDTVYAAATRTLVAAARQVTSQGYTVARVGFSAAMHSLIPVAADGHALTPALTWMDTRAAEDAEALWRTPQGPALYSRTGTPIHAMSPLCKLLWLRRAQPDVFSSAARFVSLKEWVWQGWLGAWEVDASLASATGLYALAQHAWDAEAHSLAGISPDRLSALVPTTAIRRGVREPALRKAGITDETAFVIGASDGVLANLGVGAITREEMVITIGTSCAVRLGTPRPVTDPATRSFCYVLASERYIAGGPSNSGGIVLDWLYHDLLSGRLGVPPEAWDARDEANRFARLLAAAATVHDEQLIVLPYLSGERAPLWNAHATAACLGLSVRHTAAHVLRAAVEGILFNALWIAESLFIELGRPARLVASGKVLEAPWIRQLAADIFELPVAYRGAIDASVLGAVAIAEIATGERAWEDAATPASGADDVLTPSASGRYAEKYARFREMAALLGGGAGVSSVSSGADPAAR